MKRWSDEAWDDYLYWQKQDKKTLKRINMLIKDIEKMGYCTGLVNQNILNIAPITVEESTKETGLSTTKTQTAIYSSSLAVGTTKSSVCMIASYPDWEPIKIV